MADRTLLILTYHFPPSSAAGAYRTIGFVRHLSDFGWRCVVVAPPGLPWEPVDHELETQIPSDAIVQRVPFFSGRLSTPIRMWAPFTSWLLRAWPACARLIRQQRPDVMLTSGPPHAAHLLGRHFHRWARLPWVADFRDPWVMGDPSQTHKNVSGWERSAELSVMREANAVVANTPGASNLLRQAYPRYASKITSITNGYDPERFGMSASVPLSGSTIEIVHTGEIYAGRSPAPFLDAVHRLDPVARHGKALRIRFIGGVSLGKQKHEIDDRVQRELKGSVFFEDRIPYSQSIRAMLEADILLLLDTPRRRAGVPAKLFEYIGAGRPILALAEPDSDVAWVLKESGLPHRIASPLDVEAIRHTLIELLHDPSVARLGEQSERVLSRFTRKCLAGELADLLDSCVKTSRVHISDPSLTEVVL